MATGLTSRLTRGKLADMPETRTRHPGPDRRLSEGSRPRAQRADRVRPPRGPDALLPRWSSRRPGPVVRMEGARAPHARLEQLPRPDRRRTRQGGRARRARALRDRPDRVAPHERHDPAAPRSSRQEIADWLGAEDALVFTTGYQANVGCLSGVLSASDTVIVGLRRPRLDPRRLQALGSAPSAVSPQPARQARADARAGRRRRGRRAGRRGRRLLDGGRRLRRRERRGAVPSATARA